MSLPEPVVMDDQQQRNNNALDVRLQALERKITQGRGVPAHSPTSPQLYFREDFGVGTSIYGWDGSTWAALV